MNRKTSTAGLFVLIAALGAGVSAPRAEGKPSAETLVSTPQAFDPTAWRTAISSVARDCGPSVVHIEVTDRKEPSGSTTLATPDRSLAPFFGLPNSPRPFKQERKGLGSGIILDTSGHVLTNAHVVNGAALIEVSLASGERTQAKLVGLDSKTDLAVLQIPGSASLRPVTFGDSDRLEVGEWVVAIGDPRGLDHTVTQGIISAKHRRGITDPTSYGDFLQTDTAINPGNSGGPLLNLSGQVIGINALIASSSGGSEGIGFAIPSNMAAHIVRQLIADGKVERGWLGVTTAPLTPETGRRLGLEVSGGALIADVVAGGPAATGGVKRGQVVIGFEGNSIESDLDLRNRVAAVRPGAVAVLRVLEDGRPRNLSVTIGDLAAVSKGRVALAESRLGLSVRDVTGDETKLYRLRPSSGVVVTAIDPKGPATSQGLEVGDIILEIQGHAIENTEMFGIVVLIIPPGEEFSVLAVDHRTGEDGYLSLTAH